MKSNKEKYLLTIKILLFVLIVRNTYGQVDDVQLYTFAHSLIDHRPPAIPTPSDETTILHWIHDIAQHTGKTFGTTGQFGQLANHVDGLPPNSNLGYDTVPYSWNEEETSFSNSPLNTIMLTAANFIQYSDPSDPDPADPSGRTVINLTETIFDWTENEIPGMRYYIYGNWPEMDLNNSFPPTLPSQFEIDEFHDITIGNTGSFANWWTSYQDQIIASRPELDTKLIPTGMIISKILTQLLSNQIAFDELYEDSDPHGRANIYFLAGMITYMAIFEENVPITYIPGDIIDNVIINNLEEIKNYTWNELSNFNFQNGNSRVFFDNTTNSYTELNIEEEIILLPNPTTRTFKISSTFDSEFSLQIQSVDGTVYKKINSTNSTKLHDITSLPAGIYLVQIRDLNNGQLFIKKLIKN